ncbi:MAG: RNA dependent RNA polymerase [Oscillospiraceae bacterium]
MPQTKYRIYELSARAVLSYAVKEDGGYSFYLSGAATEKCKAAAALHEQDGNAFFFQTMCALRGNEYSERAGGRLITDLSDIIFYMDFSGIFDRRAAQRKQLVRQQKAEAMFRPEGVSLDFGSGEHRYLAFERSGSMSRQARLSFIRADYYDLVRRRIMMDMTVGDCQLSKLYAYNGLMLSSGVRIENIGIDKPHRVIVIDNPVSTVHNVKVITVADDGSQGSTRKYHREEKKTDIDVMSFDGEGLISKEYARVVDKAYCGQHIHTSFQIRLPYIKGMLHQVDFKDFFKSAGMDALTDIYGVSHNVQDVDIILTKSQFKGYGWLKDSGRSWEDYWDAFRRYRHALYITGVSKEKPEAFTELNYQFLTTVSIRAEEFRPVDLPPGWDHSPAEDNRRWLTKETELAYYNYCANEQFRQDYFLEALNRRSLFSKSREQRLARILKKNPLFISEPVYAKQLDAMADSILKQYAVGRLIVAGDNRYLSGDLLDFMALLMPLDKIRTRRENTFFLAAMNNYFRESVFYAPGAAYEHGDSCTLLRNPHIARNEEVQLSVYSQKDNMRKYYLSHLTDVVMVDTHTLASERLGGADYDGDMIKTISDPILNECVRRNYEFDKYKDISNQFNIPLLMIPAAEPQIRDANDWHARFETVRSTFSSRIGQICNAALDRSIIAYNENLNAEECQHCREETETLAILTGLEIDSAKSGIRPDLDEYLTRKTVRRSAFLQYKNLVEDAETRRAWYEPTHAEKIKSFFKKVDWNKIDSNVERLPYLAYQLKQNTPRIKAKPAADSELFTFAQEEHWKEQLDKAVFSAVSALLEDYETCLSRIRACRAPARDMPRKKDIDRTLYVRGQEEQVDSDELYALFQNLPPERVSALRQAMREQSWHFMDEQTREVFLLTWLPDADFIDYHDLLADFRFGGYRILGDLVCDIDDDNTAQERKKLFRESDSEAFTTMMRAYADRPFSQTYRETVAEKCRELMDRIVRPDIAVRYVVTLGKRNLLWELLIDQVEKNVLSKEGAPC